MSVRVRHRQTQYHDPSNPDCSYSDDPHAWGPDSSDWCSCPLPPPAYTKRVERPRSMGEPGKVPELDAGWDAHAAGLERKTVEVFSAGNGMALLGWDIRQTLVAREDWMRCSKCRALRQDQEIITNFGICDACFDALPCPCDEGRPLDCPQHGPEGR